MEKKTKIKSSSIWILISEHTEATRRHTRLIYLYIIWALIVPVIAFGLVNVWALIFR